MFSKTEFPFPSNGNAEHKFLKPCPHWAPLQQFRFPSNGNAHRKVDGATHQLEWKFVFPFPSNGKPEHKEIAHSSAPSAIWCFHSLQTGTRIPRSNIRILDEIAISFRFPSNGNAHRKCTKRKMGASFVKSFDSLQMGTRIARLLLTSITMSSVSRCFHSLQTGKGNTSPKFNMIEDNRLNTAFPFPSNGNAHRKEISDCGRTDEFWFRFPSNGNAHRKSCKRCSICSRGTMSFDSLQTGTHIASIQHIGYRV